MEGKQETRLLLKPQRYLCESLTAVSTSTVLVLTRPILSHTAGHSDPQSRSREDSMPDDAMASSSRVAEKACAAVLARPLELTLDLSPHECKIIFSTDSSSSTTSSTSPRPPSPPPPPPATPSPRQPLTISPVPPPVLLTDIPAKIYRSTKSLTFDFPLNLSTSL